MAHCRLWLVLGVALLSTACGKSGPGPATSPAPAAKQTAPAPAAKRDAKAAADAEKPLTLTRLNEDGSETVEETTGDSGARNPLLAAVASTVAAATSSGSASAAAGSPWVEGTHYTRVVPAQPTDVPAGQVEVLEFFWYACPHCYALEPTVLAWNKTKAPYITFTRVPVLWSDEHRAVARLYYTLVAMGKADQVHADVFKEIQVNNDPLISSSDPGNATAAERLQAAFIRKEGLSDTEFLRNEHSPFVETAMQRADQLVQRYRITAVPTFVINGKYVADASTAGSPERLMALISDLAAQEHKH